MALQSAIGRNDIESVKHMIKEDPSIINSEIIDGFTPLMKSIGCGYTHITKLLLENGADVNVLSDVGTTAIIMAAVLHNEEVVKLLIEKECEVDRSGDGFSVLRETVGLRIMPFGVNINIIKLLLNYGADINSVSKTTNCIFHYAHKNCNYELIKLLIFREDIDLNWTNSLNNTPLMDLIKFSLEQVLEANEHKINFWLDTVKLLVSDHRVDLDIKNRNGETYIDMVNNSYKLKNYCSDNKKYLNSLKRTIREALDIRYNLINLCVYYIKNGKFSEKDISILPKDIRKFFKKSEKDM